MFEDKPNKSRRLFLGMFTPTCAAACQNPGKLFSSDKRLELAA
jgi:hypothetical protein